ncbi:MAG: IS4 family transposase [Cyanobacteriota bacterium]|nr:IS4 family transposase [Cyanobacteriota bacterium]
MLPQFYQTHLQKYLSESQLITLKLLVWLWQSQKQVKIERLAATLPLPIQQNSRRRHIQRFLKLTRLSVVLVWFPLIKEIITQRIPKAKRLIIALDRTAWQENNILIASAIYQKRAFPIFWILLSKKGASNLREQQIVLRPVIKLFKAHQIVIVGDREFHSVDLAEWIDRQGVKFVLRQKKDTNFRRSGRKFNSLSSVQIAPGQREFFSEINTQKKGFGRFNLAVYWRRKYKNKQEKNPWYLLTNLGDLETAVKAYKQRWGIEAMFKDCKTGGYNLEDSQASQDKLVRLVLLIAIRMTTAWLQGEKTSILRKSPYICRQKEAGRTKRRHSNFWVGLYGHNWIVAFHECEEWVEELVTSVRNKRTFYQRGLKTLTLIQQAL